MTPEYNDLGGVLNKDYYITAWLLGLMLLEYRIYLEKETTCKKIIKDIG